MVSRIQQNFQTLQAEQKLNQYLNDSLNHVDPKQFSQKMKPPLSTIQVKDNVDSVALLKNIELEEQKNIRALQSIEIEK